jgi:hypothetical protein
LEEEGFTDVLIPKAGSNQESIEALDKSKAGSLVA